MTLSEIWQLIQVFMEELYAEYGERIDYLEVYDGQILVHFKKEVKEDD